ncbi:hypothetical protein [Tenacibaculum xiamenense]|uniref:hypothetical protein n=1 Tax=Tenacibaculum xiamenense TaxID=1261553 RepID=UPI003893C6B5
MKLFIFKTDINTKQKVESMNDVLGRDNEIIDVSIDLEDIDNVLRVETTDFIEESDIVNRVHSKGFYCAELAD